LVVFIALVRVLERRGAAETVSTASSLSDKCEFRKHQRSLSPMPIEITVAHDATDSRRAIEKRSSIGNWEVHSWGDGKFPGMAAVSAITTLQIGATLAATAADRQALNKAVDYLMDTLATQLKSFQQSLAAD
jgi:hypothetical protein